MKIETLVLGQLQTNCYLVWNEKSKEAIVIDPADEADFIIRKLLDWNLKLNSIIATHGHFDHVLAVLELKLAFNVPFLMNNKDNFLLERSQKSSLYFTGFKPDPTPKPDKSLKEDDEIVIGNKKLKVIETPGHTPGGISLCTQEILFSGDTLFSKRVGRTDLSYSDQKELDTSLKKIFRLPRNTIVYPGHGPQTTIEQEIIL